MKKLLISFFIFLMGCGNSDILQPALFEDSPNGSAKLTLSIPSSIPRKAVNRVEYTVTGIGIEEEIKGMMSIQDNMAVATIEKIPVGSDRQFYVEVFDDGGIITYEGNGWTDVEHNKTTTLHMTVERKKFETHIYANFPSNTTNVIFTFSGEYVAEPIVVEEEYDWTGTYRFYSVVPTGQAIRIDMLAYEDSKENITAQGFVTAKIEPGEYAVRIDVTFSKGTGDVELTVEFVGKPVM